MSSERFHLNGAEILVGADVDEAIRIAAGQFAALARKITAEGRDFHAALSGGGTPQRLFVMLAAEPFVSLVPWSKIHFYWGDERDLPPTDAQNNYAMARDLLLSRVPAAAARIHRIPTGDGTAVEAAEMYQRTLLASLPTYKGHPRLDYTLLGVGKNGHTASLFPHRPTLHERVRLVVADHVDEAGMWRVSMTAPVLNHAAQITFLALGAEKAEVVEKVLTGPRDAENTPSQLIAATDGNLSWVLDSAAAARLPRP